MKDGAGRSGSEVGTGSDFDAFLSHSTKDKPAARELKQALEGRKLTIWFDEEQLRPGMSWQPLLEQGLQQAGSVVVAIGGTGMGPWQNEETRAALNNAEMMQRPVIPVLLPTAPPGDVVLGAFLQTRMWVDLRGGYSEDLVDRLVWGITGQKPIPAGSPGPLQTQAASKWILVAGSGGTTPIPDSIEAVSKRLGVALAISGFGLVTGGWNGVDDFVARAFASQIQQNGQSLSGRLVQVMQEGALPHFPAGRLVSGGSEEDAWVRSISRADAVVLIGGLGGTYRTGEVALQLGKYVFPLADTRVSKDMHDDAYRFYFAMLRDWENCRMSNISEDDFLAVSNPSPGVVADLVKLLGRVLLT
ncbi:TIR domain-containing protein [Mesorhizobium sp. VK4C]|uniref:TIR domain-containing protein n=1 Tax=Mesorhizobium captivum TaxID=3072319 RepID=UPI002A24CB55|nr:TIR domain-containing protein [Mesorhizobium sp. VK4C]MDX8501919.1 TIR domain-containing protein [Mesorhizobium sp. VK4C]